MGSNNNGRMGFFNSLARFTSAWPIVDNSQNFLVKQQITTYEKQINSNREQLENHPQLKIYESNQTR